jgi:hypothetical protein
MASTPRKIRVSVNGNTFSYSDESGHPASNKHIHEGDTDTIQWESDDGDIAIYFADGRLFCPVPHFPITARKGNWTPAYKVCAHQAAHDYKYDVIVDNGSNPPPQDDPHIMFDVVFDGGDKLGFPSPDAIATAAETAWGKIVDKLTSLKAAEETSGIQFYPHGITNIQVSVEVTPVTVSIQVSGPDA